MERTKKAVVRRPAFAPAASMLAVFVLAALSPALAGCGRQAEPPTGSLIVKSEPSAGADILLDGRPQKQKTDTVFRALKPGRYHVELNKASPDASAAPKTGEATVEVKPRQTTRIVIELNRSALAPAVPVKAVVPRTRGQQSIFDFYAAITAGDPVRAFGYLGPEAQRAQGGVRGFTKTWESVLAVRIEDIETTSFDPTATVEVNQVALDVVAATATPGAAVEPTPRRATITTSEDDFGGSGLPRILLVEWDT